MTVALIVLLFLVALEMPRPTLEGARTTGVVRWFGAMVAAWAVVVCALLAAILRLEGFL